MEIDSERQGEIVPSPRNTPLVQRETIEPIDQIDRVDPIAAVNIPRDIVVGRKRPAWSRQNLQEEEGHATPRSTFRESQIPQRYTCYVAAMSHNH
jgi:hypothetical protein